jgi:hypothetical protein
MLWRFGTLMREPVTTTSWMDSSAALAVMLAALTAAPISNAWRTARRMERDVNMMKPPATEMGFEPVA